jgi:hypothetical protein
MAFYCKSIAITKSTARLSAMSTPIKTWAGVIHHVEVMFPEGCSGLAHVQILHGSHSLYPADGDDSFCGDGETIKFDDYYELGENDNTLTVVTWNLDEGYDHAPQVRIGVLPKWVVAPYFMLTSLLDVLSMMGRRLGIK